MRMKEDHMLNGQLKPGYNIQIGTENGFVIGYDIFPNPTDTKTLKPHLENMRHRLGTLPQRLIADAGYGSNENLAYLEERNVEALVKYNTFHKEASRTWKKNPFRTENWPYDSENDLYTCPAGRHLKFTKETSTTTETGYRQKLKIYTCDSCGDCPRKQECTSAKGNRSLQRNEEMLRLRRQARERLTSESGTVLRKRRAVEVETVFGEIKGNHGFRRFHLRGKNKVAVEWGLQVIGYNIRRMMLQV